MQNYQYLQLLDLNETGFGIIYEDHPRMYTPPHWHEAAELLLFVQGATQCRFANRTIHAKPGELYLINSQEVHETRCSADAMYLCIHIVPSVMCRYVPDFDLLDFSLMFDPEDREKAAAYAELTSHMKEIFRLCQKETRAYQLECHAHLFAAAAILVRHFSRTLAVEEKQLQRSDMSRLEPILQYTQLHHGEELTLDGAANAMVLNREYFCRLFKKNMGVSYLQYVNQVRATAVCRELETSEDPIGVIGERHGFTNPKMMNQYFREVYGCTPSEKRRAYREMKMEIAAHS